jgi:hypothetical protein
VTKNDPTPEIGAEQGDQGHRDATHDRLMSVADVAAKVDWEGGLVEAIAYYGLPASEIADPRLAELWATAASAFDAHLHPILDEIERLLDEAAADGSETQ